MIQTTIDPKTITSFQEMIFSWWDKNKRDLPWRHTHDPYKILVSEIMLQQTQVSRVVTKYEEFTSVLPGIAAVAQARPADILRLWRGLGYNRRALYLQGACRTIYFDYKGIFPQEEAELNKLPGLGKYTARAILVFAFKKNTAMVDTNIRKIITYYFFDRRTQSEPVIERMAEEILPDGRSWEWHQALMDYGALVLPSLLPKTKKRTPGISFIHTKRFLRGKIIDYLRDHPTEDTVVLQLFIQTQYPHATHNVSDIISDLISEGLLVQSESGRISLP